MADKTQRKNLGRGLSALIPDVDMDFLSQIVRDEPKIPVTSRKKQQVGLVSESQSNPQALPKNIKHKATLNAADAKLEAPSPKGSVDKALNAAKHKENISTEDIADKIEYVPVGNIEANPYQPRRFFSPQELGDLVDSLREHGVLQPVILRPVPDNDSIPSDNQYQLIAGERRWRAAQTAGLSKIPAIIRPVTDQQALELALIENVQRHDISALDAAIAYRRLSQEFSLSQEQVAQRVGKSRSSIANTIRLLDLPAEAQQAIEEGALSEGHGRAILLASSDGARRAVLRRVLRDKLSVRDAEELARKTSGEFEDKISTDDTPLTKERLTPEARRIEEGLQKHFGTRVKLKLRRQGGQILIHYFSNEELDRLLKLIIK